MLWANLAEKEELAKPENDRDKAVLARAAHWRRYDLDRLPDDAKLWTRAAEILMELLDAKVGVGPQPTTCRVEALKAARKAVALDRNLPAAQDVLKRSEAANQNLDPAP